MFKYLYLAVSMAVSFAAQDAWAGKAPANKPPVVSLTSPANGAAFTAPATITLSASASDADGTVTKVEFYRGTTLIGTSTAAPYSVNWANVASGTYDLTAKATDNLGATASSAISRVTVSGSNIILTSPANGAAVYGGSVNVSGSFNGDAMTTVLVDNGNSTRLAKLNGNTFSVTVPVFIGANTLNILVSRRDRTFDTASVTVTGHDVPRIAWKQPAAASFDAPATFTFAVDAVSASGTISKVDFYRNGALLATVTTPPYQTVVSNLGAGSHTLFATATDNNAQAASVMRTIQVVGPNVPPAVSMSAPTDGAVFLSPASIELKANASDPDGSISQVEFLRGGEVVATAYVAPYAATLNNVAPGSFTYSARATDNRGGSATSVPVTVSVVSPNAAPTIVLTSPADGNSFIAPALVELSATAADSDGTVAKVEFFQGSTLIGTDTAAPYSFSWTHVPAGSYLITARATDNAGGRATSVVAGIFVAANNAPAVSVSNSSSGEVIYAPGQVVLSATAEDSDGSIARVEFHADGSLIGTATSAPYSFTWSEVSAGSHSVTAVAYDNLGASAVSPPVTVTIRALGLTLDEPGSGTSISGDSVLVSGTLQGPLNTGVTVNGVVAAQTDDNHFYARVPLEVGVNSLEAVLTTPSGQSATQSVIITSDGLTSPLKVSHDTLEGPTPLVANFELVNDGESDSSVQVNGGAPFTLEPGGAASVAFTVGGPGVSLVTIAATDAQGSTSVQNFAVVTNDPVKMDLKFKTLWAGMNDAVAAGETAAVMSYLSVPARDKYGPVFTALQANYAQIAASFSPMRNMSMSAVMSEYAVNRTINGENRIFFVYFLRDLKGVWRLDSM